MPSQPVIRYALDPTGVNANNAVFGELQTLTQLQIRAVSPTYGPFFTESVKIFDHVTNRELVRGEEFKFVEVLQDATMKFGKEIAQLVLIINPDVSSQVRINYQVLGGLYQKSTQALVNIYNTFLQDDRPVDWINVLNKPYEYPPTLHRHLLEDIYGFEPVIVALERIRNAITLSDVPAFEALISWIRNNVVSEEEINIGEPNQKYVTFERLLYSLQNLNFNAITLTPSKSFFGAGDILKVDLSSTNFEEPVVLYWTIEHQNTEASNFGTTSGVINVSANRGSMLVNIRNNSDPNRDGVFRIQVRRDSNVGQVLAKTGWLKIARRSGIYAMSDYYNACCLFNPMIQVNPYSVYILGGLNA